MKSWGWLTLHLALPTKLWVLFLFSYCWWCCHVVVGAVMSCCCHCCAAVVVILFLMSFYSYNFVGMLACFFLVVLLLFLPCCCVVILSVFLLLSGSCYLVLMLLFLLSTCLCCCLIILSMSCLKSYHHLKNAESHYGHFLGHTPQYNQKYDKKLISHLNVIPNIVQMIWTLMGISILSFLWKNYKVLEMSDWMIPCHVSETPNQLHMLEASEKVVKLFQIYFKMLKICSF